MMQGYFVREESPNYIKKRYTTMEDRPKMILCSMESGIARMKAMLRAADLILTGEDCVEGEDLETLKDLRDMMEECVLGMEQKSRETPEELSALSSEF